MCLRRRRRTRRAGILEQIVEKKSGQEKDSARYLSETVIYLSKSVEKAGDFYSKNRNMWYDNCVKEVENHD